MQTLSVIDLGRTSYGPCWELQKRLADERAAGACGDLLLFTEHEHVYTIGKGGDDNHLLATAAELRAQGTEVYRVDRGGDITYHGPGQIVGYPILDLTAYRKDLHWYLRSLEEVIIRTLADVGIAGERDDGMTGVWVNGEKIAAIGVRVSRWVTMHGFALNVSTDLTKFGRIIPCGIFHKGVTSCAALLDTAPSTASLHALLAKHFGEVFGVVPRPEGSDAAERIATADHIPIPMS